ncbi:hypothetical protein [Burkholderia vietnamiensis]|uniref:hypothetical protein n=1 Tax=Burkholderia vietnamiensis TaxID=60552 RepID=UPI003C7E88C0
MKRHTLFAKGTVLTGIKTVAFVPAGTLAGISNPAALVYLMMADPNRYARLWHRPSDVSAPAIRQACTGRFVGPESIYGGKNGRCGTNPARNKGAKSHDPVGVPNAMARRFE